MSHVQSFSWAPHITSVKACVHELITLFKSLCDSVKSTKLIFSKRMLWIVLILIIIITDFLL